MEKADRETHDFMNVSSFSQLPFIRPSPAKDKAGAIRLFGKEFGGGGAAAVMSNDLSDQSTENSSNVQDGEGSNNTKAGGVNEDSSSRKFECHYCCRNFPTSQALGGHQNAHKRERQHAKRAHLQSAMMSEAAGFCSMMNNYGRIGATPNFPMAYHHHHPWNSSTTTNTYGSNAWFYNPYSQRQPINGSPLAMWQIQAPHASPVVTPRDDQLKSAMGAASQIQFGYKSKPTNQDHLSLDLHL